MPKFFFKRVLPDYQGVQRFRIMRPLSRFFGGAAIWRVNRQSVALGLAIGAFFGALPVPIQMLLAGASAIGLKGNLPAALVATLWSNPLTMPPVFYFNYRIGAWLLNSPTTNIDSGVFGVDSLRLLGGHILLPLFSGSLLVGAVLAPIVYLGVIGWWRTSLILRHRRRVRR